MKLRGPVIGGAVIGVLGAALLLMWNTNGGSERAREAGAGDRKVPEPRGSPRTLAGDSARGMAVLLESETPGDSALVRVRGAAKGAGHGFATVLLLDISDRLPEDAAEQRAPGDEESDIDSLDAGRRWSALGFASVRDVLGAVGLEATQAWIDDSPDADIIATHIDKMGRERLVMISAPAPRADLDADGRLTAADVAEFLDRLAARDPGVDWNEDAVIDNRDLAMFLSDWAGDAAR